MKYCLVISCPPESPVSNYAFEFCSALERQQHELERIFFLGAGVQHGSLESDAAVRWRVFANTHKLCCSASLDDFLPANPNGNRLHPDFVVAGLGQLIEAETVCDRIVSFGRNTRRC